MIVHVVALGCFRGCKGCLLVSFGFLVVYGLAWFGAGTNPGTWVPLVPVMRGGPGPLWYTATWLDCGYW
jgi:hypothetical protein